MRSDDDPTEQEIKAWLEANPLPTLEERVAERYWRDTWEVLRRACGVDKEAAGGEDKA